VYQLQHSYGDDGNKDIVMNVKPDLNFNLYVH
jgi:hypothetical protein